MNMQSPSPALSRADQDGVAVLTLCRPEKRNPLSEALIAALTAELDAIAADKSIRAVIIRGGRSRVLGRPRPEGDVRPPRRR